MGVPPAPLGSVQQAPCTVYVGRISSEVSDDFVRQLLEKCGTVTKWNRAADPNTSKLTSFGFCDFEEPRGVWRALEFLHERQLCDKRLLVKCEERAKQTIDTWKAGRRLELAKKRAEAAAEKEKDGKGEEAGESSAEKKPKLADADVKPLNDEELDEELQAESKEFSDKIQKLLADKNKGYPEVKAEATAPDEKEQGDEREKAAGGAGGGEKKERADEDASNDKDKDKENNNNKEPEKKQTRLSRSEERRREREAEKKAAVSRHYRQSRRERDREQRIKDHDRDIEKEYQYRIREFERAEEHRIKNLKRELRDLELPTEPSDREKRKFVERDLAHGEREGDEREWKRYREERRHERQREFEKDLADRALVQKQLEEERRRKEKEIEDERRRKEKEAEEERRRKEKEAEEERRKKEEEDRARRKEAEEARRKAKQEAEEEKRRAKEEEKKRKEAEQKKQQEAAANQLMQKISTELSVGGANSKLEPVASGTMAGPTGAQAMSALFREGEPELDAQGNPRKHMPLTRLDGDAKPRDSHEEMRRLIQQVPTDKTRAFAFEIDWDVVHEHGIIEKKLRPWVRKKVTEYLGAEEQGMIEFIMRKVGSHTPPNTILAELEGFLDEEAENFTLKMWRMLIFEVLRVKAR